MPKIVLYTLKLCSQNIGLSSIYNRIQTSESRWQQQQIVVQATPFAEGVACMTKWQTPAKLRLSGSVLLERSIYLRYIKTELQMLVLQSNFQSIRLGLERVKYQNWAQFGSSDFWSFAMKRATGKHGNAGTETGTRTGTGKDAQNGTQYFWSGCSQQGDRILE